MLQTKHDLGILPQFLIGYGNRRRPYEFDEGLVALFIAGAVGVFIHFAVGDR